MKLVELSISTIIMWIMCYIIGRHLFEEKSKPNYKKAIIAILLASILVFLINQADPKIFGGIVKIIIIYGILYSFYSILFNKTSSQILTGSIIVYLTLVISETLVAIILSIFFHFLQSGSMTVLKNTIFINSFIMGISYILIMKFRGKYIPLIKNSSYGKKSGITIVVIILLTIAILFFRIPLSNWTFNIEFITTMILLLCFTLIGIIVLRQKAEITKTKTMYQQLASYSDITNGLLEDYRIISHEHKNQLSIIRGMIDESNRKLIEYVDGLLDKKSSIKYEWVNQLNYLPLSGLKGLINYKLIEMKSQNINTAIIISKEISKVKLNKLSMRQQDNLYSIIGIYLDNAIQAAIESKKKEVSLEIYKEGKAIKIVLANTYKGKINVDKIDDYGYTTKGKNRGTGLHIVKGILNDERMFSQTRTIIEGYYVQELKIDLS